MTKRVVVFLDIDGVLNNDRTKDRINRHMGIDTVNVKALNTLLSSIGEYDIVLSSTWKEHYKLERVYDWMVARGYTGKCFIDKTPDRGGYSYRSTEIKAWLADHGDNYKDYIIIDDIDMKEVFGNNQILTYEENGLVING